MTILKQYTVWNAYNFSYYRSYARRIIKFEDSLGNLSSLKLKYNESKMRIKWQSIPALW